MSPLKTSTSALILLTLLFASVSAFAEEDQLKKALQQLADRENALGQVHANTLTDPLQKQRYKAAKDVFFSKHFTIRMAHPGQSELGGSIVISKIQSFDLDPRACELRLGFIEANQFKLVHIKLNSGQIVGQGGGAFNAPYLTNFSSPGNTSVKRLGYEQIVPKTSNASSVVKTSKATSKLRIEGINPASQLKEVVKYVCPQGGKA